MNALVECSITQRQRDANNVLLVAQSALTLRDAINAGLTIT